jgi:hypothetical protein
VVIVDEIISQAGVIVQVIAWGKGRTNDMEQVDL